VTRLKLTFCLYLFSNIYIIHHNVTNVQSARRRSTVMWSIEWEIFSLALSQASWISNPNPSTDLGESSIRGVVFIWSWEEWQSQNGVFNFVIASMLTSYIIMSLMFGQLDVDRSWCDPLNEESFLWRSPKHLGSQTLIHQIDQSKALIRGVVLIWSW